MTDETFTAYDIRGKIQEGVSLEVAWNIGKALADWLHTYGKVALLRGEGSNEILVGAIAEGLRLQGRDTVDHGRGGKDELIATIKDNGYSGGVLIAHDKEQDVCVIELYEESGQLIAAANGLNDIAEMVRAGNFVPAAQKGELTAVA